MEIERIYKIPSASFFLFGPRGVGKSTYIRAKHTASITIDLLSQKSYLALHRNPSLLEGLVGHLKPGDVVAIDEIQRIPDLLSEVHRLMEDRKLNFILTGSSARKLKRVGANLLAGRAHTYKMFPLSLREIGDRFSLEAVLQFGGLPLALRDTALADETLASYVGTYLQEEIREEALVRKIDYFNRFLQVAGQLNGAVLNMENIARETGRSAKTISNWYLILEETLLVSKIEAYRPGFKVRETSHPKYYWFDHAVARTAAGLIWADLDNSAKGFEFECLILREIQIYMEVARRQKPIFYYHTPGAGELDFIIETRPKSISKPQEFISIEVKYSKAWKREFEAPSRSLRSFSGNRHKRMMGVYLGSDRITNDGFEVLPLSVFIAELFAGNIF